MLAAFLMLSSYEHHDYLVGRSITTANQLVRMSQAKILSLLNGRFGTSLSNSNMAMFFYYSISPRNGATYLSGHDDKEKSSWDKTLELVNGKNPDGSSVFERCDLENEPRAVIEALSLTFKPDFDLNDLSFTGNSFAFETVETTVALAQDAMAQEAAEEEDAAAAAATVEAQITTPKKPKLLMDDPDKQVEMLITTTPEKAE